MAYAEARVIDISGPTGGDSRTIRHGETTNYPDVGCAQYITDRLNESFKYRKAGS